MDQLNHNGTFDRFGGFDWSNYTAFASMLVASILVGVYFGCFGSKQKSPLDYLLGGKQMSPFPVALSMVASNISANTLVAMPAEVYTQNATSFLNIFTNTIGAIVSYYFFIPIYFELNLNNPYKYLELRFNKHIQTLATIFCCISYFLYLGVVICLPSMTLSLITGIDEYIINICVSIICIFYTMIGGLKAVIWADFFQIIIALLAVIVIVVTGTINTGGITKVMQLAYDGGKLNMFDFDPSPFIRTTFWNFVGGGLITSICGYTVSQSSCQRYLSMKSLKNLSTMLIYYNIGFPIIWGVSIYGGILLYAAYYGCDPIKEKIISKDDHIYTLYIMEKITIPAIPGLFIAGVFGAGLSTLSTGLNTIAGIIYNDYLITRVSEKRAHIAMKLVTVVVGTLSSGLGLMVSKMGKIVSSTAMITSVTFVPIFVAFVLGMCIPTCNNKGAMAGIISSTLFLGSLCTGNILSEFNHIKDEVYPNISTCAETNPARNFSESTLLQHSENFSVDPEDIFPLFRLSYTLYTAYGLAVGVIIGVITSYMTGAIDPATLDPRLISPPLRRFLPKKSEKDESIVLEKLMLSNK